MRKLCFVLIIALIVVLGFATIGAANSVTLPSASKAPLNSHIHADSTTEIGTLGIIMGPVGEW